MNKCITLYPAESIPFVSLTIKPAGAKPISKAFSILLLVLSCLGSLPLFSQNIQTLPFPSNNNQGSYAAAGGFYGPMAATATANQYSRYAYVYPYSLIGSPTANASGTLLTSGSIINSLEFDRGFSSSVTMNNSGNLKIYLVNLSSATTDWGSSSLNWTTQTGASTLVYNANPSSIVNGAASKPGNVSFPITAFTYTGGSLGVLIEYTQTTGQTAEISWGYENGSTITQYVANSALGIVGTGTPSNTLGNTNSQSAPAAVRHPTLKIDFTAPTVTTNAVSGSPFCSGAAVSVSFTSTGTFTSNTYTAQLSNAAGSFSSPVNIGSIASTANAGTISCTVPAGTATGSGYRIRVVSSSPAIQGSDNGTNLTITASPSASISYTASPYCKNLTSAAVTQTGTSGGSYTSASGLSINAASGIVNPSTSTAGTYTVTYTVATTGGCSVYSTTATVTIVSSPTAGISYASSPYCSNGGTATVTQTGTAGGTYSSTTGLSIAASTGIINLSTSTAGTYTVTYSFASGGCTGTTTAAVTITAAPVATFSYTGTPYCQSSSNPLPTFSGGGAAGTFSSTAGLVFVSTSTGQINLGASTPGAYTVTNTRAAASGCSQVSATSSITVTATPSATISYTGSPYCTGAATTSVTRTGTAGGTYSSTSGLSINNTTGEINLSASTAGTYAVTYSVSAAGGCSLYSTTAPVTIRLAPTALTVTPSSATLCAGTIQPLTTTGGVQSAIAITEGFNSATNSWTKVNSSTGGFTPSAAAWTLRPDAYDYVDFFGFNEFIFHSNDNSQFYLSNSDDQGFWFNTYSTSTTLTSPAINTTSYQSLSLNFSQSLNVGNNDIGAVQVSTDGTNFTTIQSYTTSQGTETYNASADIYNEGFSAAAIDLGAYIGKPTLYIRFTYTANFGNWWAIDNVSLSGNAQGTITWSPITNLYTNTAATTAYTNGAGAPTIYAKPSANATYTATVANTSGCQVSGTSTLTVNALPTASISPVSGSACEGTAVQVNITGTPGALIGYKLNGTTQTVQSLPYPFNSPTNAGTYAYTLQSVTANGCTGTITNGASTVTINPYPVVAAIGGSNYAQTGTTTQLTNITTGGVWASSATSVASLGATSGTPVTVTGVAKGLSNISYTVTANTCSTTVNKSIRIYNPDYITKADGNFSTAANWHIDRGDNTFAEGVQAPASGNYSSISIANAITLDQDFAVQSGKTFSIINGGTFNISPSKVFSSLGTVDFGGKAVTVKSNATGTGSIGQMASNISNATNVTVERYIPKKRSWRLMTAPVTGTTIHAAWQEGSLYNNGINTPAVAAGYGTIITGYAQGTAANANGHGYDFWDAVANNVSSLRYYDYATHTWLTYPAITSTLLSDKPAYMLFIRGDRTVTTDTSATTLRATGTLQQGNILSAINSSNGSTALVSNPFASILDFAKVYLSNTSLLQDKFLFWNAKLSNYGAYEAVVGDGSGSNYAVVPNAFVTGGIDNTVRFLQSGEGFFVYPKAGLSGNVSIGEAAKSASATGGTNPYRISAATESKLYVNLNIKTSDTSALLADGFMLRYDNTYDAGLDDDDAVKQSNFNENLGIVSNANNLIVEARPSVAKTDTVQMKMWNVGKKTYQLQVKGESFANAAMLHAFLEDSYAGSKQELSLSGSITTYDFVVNTDTASYSYSRFRIVFQNNAAVLPVTLTSVKAAPQNGGVTVTWTVTNEVNIKGYTVERSTDGGTSYTAIAAQNAKNNPAAAMTSYAGFDAMPKAGNNLYRIRIEGRDGSITYSATVKVTISADNGKTQITLYPNPVSSNGTVQVQLSHLPADNYLLIVYSNGGQTVYQKKIAVAAANATQSETIALNNTLAQGSYSVKITDSKGAIVFTDKLVIMR